MVLSSSKRFFTHLRRAPELAAGPPDLLRALPPELPHLGQMQFVFHARRHDPGRAGPSAVLVPCSLLYPSGNGRFASPAADTDFQPACVLCNWELPGRADSRHCAAALWQLDVPCRQLEQAVFPCARASLQPLSLHSCAKVGVAGRKGPTLADEACVVESGDPIVVVVATLR